MSLPVAPVAGHAAWRRRLVNLKTGGELTLVVEGGGHDDYRRKARPPRPAELTGPEFQFGRATWLPGRSGLCH